METEPKPNSTEAFEEALAQTDTRYYCLRLYIAGTTVHSIRALETIKGICEEYLQGRYELEVIDVYQQTELIQQENIVAVPTLIKRLPLPLQRIIGDMSKTEKVFVGLDIIPKTPEQ
ncbi:MULTISPECIES: circadian clock KaiB family protein [unclassified Coleofasciculus]|uniref:circadian clock KaiB family protein n=1 Tax=unclassified Coleofasciculus TaxID=2692782 RepID=UPI00187F69FE|nr:MULTISPECIES: circadian clock KaiB family protein [unclassified Coleofasciculus]MBE9129351.1 circadian clock KaiB family protein [Coleofasciculus sp. LEGE 07081]MBE9151985.1 circadian clock KaiB family protein [Coleofasciculus sp. LEGE 07092]